MLRCRRWGCGGTEWSANRQRRLASRFPHPDSGVRVGAVFSGPTDV